VARAITTMIEGRPQRGVFAVDRGLYQPKFAPFVFEHVAIIHHDRGICADQGRRFTNQAVARARPARMCRASTALHLHCKGQGGPTLVLEAGMAGWSQDWAFVHDGLAQAGQVCSYDRAGYGWSDCRDHTAQWHERRR